MNNRGKVSTSRIAEKLKLAQKEINTSNQAVDISNNPILFVNGNLNRKNYNYIAKNIYVVVVDPGWVIGEDDLEYIKKHNISYSIIRSGYDSAKLIEYLYNNKNRSITGRLFRVFDEYVKYKLDKIEKDSLMLRYTPIK